MSEPTHFSKYSMPSVTGSPPIIREPMRTRHQGGGGKDFLKSINVAQYYESVAERWNVRNPGNILQVFDDGLTTKQRNVTHKRQIADVLQSEIPQYYKALTYNKACRQDHVKMKACMEKVKQISDLQIYVRHTHCAWLVRKLVEQRMETVSRKNRTGRSQNSCGQDQIEKISLQQLQTIPPEASGSRSPAAAHDSSNILNDPASFTVADLPIAEQDQFGGTMGHPRSPVLDLVYQEMEEDGSEMLPEASNNALEIGKMADNRRSITRKSPLAVEPENNRSRKVNRNGSGVSHAHSSRIRALREELREELRRLESVDQAGNGGRCDEAPAESEWQSSFRRSDCISGGVTVAKRTSTLSSPAMNEKDRRGLAFKKPRTIRQTYPRPVDENAMHNHAAVRVLHGEKGARDAQAGRNRSERFQNSPEGYK